MPSSTVSQTPSLSTFLKSLKQADLETSIELFVSLLKRRQIRNARPCAIATAQLLLRVVASERSKDAKMLIDRVRKVGRKLVAAQPREMAVGNVVRRILGVIREVAGQDQDATSSESSQTLQAPGEGTQRPRLPTKISEFSPLHGASALPQHMQIQQYPPTPGEFPPVDSNSQRPPLNSQSMTSLFNILQQPNRGSPVATPPSGLQSPKSEIGTKPIAESREKLDVKAEVIDGIKELIDELDVVDSQIAESALDHIHANEIILTHTSSQTVQRFLMAAARKRKFTVVHAEAYPNNHEETHATVVNGGKKEAGDDDDMEDPRWKPLTALGITVILIPDSAVFALMSRINKVFLAPHAVLANGSLMAAAGAATIAQAAREHRVPVVVLSGVYKLSPVYPFDTAGLIEYGDPGKLVPYHEGQFIDKVDVVNPLYDFVDAELVDLYITNLGGHAPSYLYRIVADHYWVEDIDLSDRTRGKAA